MIQIYHNPRCSKSRATLTLLEERGVTPQIIHYLDTPPSTCELQMLIEKLEFSSARELMRTKESEYQALDLANETNECELLEAMHQNPKLIERPIVVHNDKAAIGRPPEQILSIL